MFYICMYFQYSLSKYSYLLNRSLCIMYFKNIHICYYFKMYFTLFFQVIITTENMCLEMFEKQYLDFDQLNLAIFNNCHKIVIKNSTYYKVIIYIKYTIYFYSIHFIEICILHILSAKNLLTSLVFKMSFILHMS